MKKGSLISATVFVVTLTSIGVLYFTHDSGKVNAVAKLNAHTTVANRSNNSSKLKKIESVGIHADFSKSYNSVKELKKDSDIIVEGKILDVKYFDFNTNTFTQSKVQVDKSFNGNVKNGDIINIIEIGGITTKGNLQKYDPEKLNIPSNELEDKVEVTLDGAPLSKKGDNVVILQRKIKNFYQLNEKAYIILNSYEGKFIVDRSHDQVKRHQGENVKDNLEISLSDMENQLAKQ